jgi:hypothetical protein
MLAIFSSACSEAISWSNWRWFWLLSGTCCFMNLAGGLLPRWQPNKTVYNNPVRGWPLHDTLIMWRGPPYIIKMRCVDVFPDVQLDLICWSRFGVRFLSFFLSFFLLFLLLSLGGADLCDLCLVYCGQERLLSWIFSMLLLQVGWSEINSGICALAGLSKYVWTKVAIGE